MYLMLLFYIIVLMLFTWNQRFPINDEKKILSKCWSYGCTMHVSVLAVVYIKVALAVNFVFFFSSPKLRYTETKKYKHVFESLFFLYLERIKYCSTFTINIESSLIHPINIFNWYQVKAAFQRKWFENKLCLFQNYIFNDKSKYFFQLSNGIFSW